MFFSTPQDIQTTVFARLPDEFRTATMDNEWVRSQPGGSPTTSLLEGPSFDRDGALWCVDIPNGRVFRVSAEGTFELKAAYDGWPNGLKFHRDGRIFIADYKHGIMEMDPVNCTVKPYLERANLERFKAVNDLFFAANGDLYFTDQGMTGLHDPSGRLFRVGMDGRITCLLDNVPSPNGLVMNRDETMIYLAVTRGNCVWRVPLTADGGVAKVGVFIQLSGGWGGPDGLALDAEGRLAIAHVGMGSVWIVDQYGEPVYRVRSCAGRHTTNLAYGGPEGHSLFITESESGSILRAELDIPGKSMFSHLA